MRQLLLVFALIFTLNTQAQEPYKNPKLSAEERAQDLLQRLTLDEKIAMMHNSSPAVERLGILPTDWWNEALHGVARAGKATVFPQTIGLAATFDPQGVYEAYSMVSDEARAKHHQYKRENSFKRYQGLTFWTPNISIFRGPRWGRGQETYGEDPYLTTVMGVAVVKGLQGDGSAPYDKTHACAKHYAVHSGPEWNRHSFDAKNISDRDLWETYLPAFKALVVDAGVKGVMCAYNRFEGKPCCASDQLLVWILREEWGFNDVVVSDCGGIDDFFKKGAHQTHADAAEASAAAVITGTDLVCGSTYKALGEAVKRDLITEQQIDISMKRLLKARFELGMMDDDELVEWSKIPYSVVECQKHLDKALEMAQKSIVLLENKNNTLPLRKGAKIAVVGPNANDSIMLWANYNGTPTKSVTILEGIKNKTPNVLFERGCEYVESRVFTDKLGCCSFNGKSGFEAKFWNSRDMSGEVVATTQVAGRFSFDAGGATVFAPGVNLTDFSARFQTIFTPDQSGETVLNVYADDGYRVFFDGVEVLADWNTSKKAAKEYVFTAIKDKPIKIEIEYFQAERNAYLHVTLGRAQEMDYTAVCDRVKEADAIVFVGGVSARIEGEEMRVNLAGFKQGDRTRIELPDVQQKMLKELKKLGKPVILVLCSGSSMALPWESQNLDAIVAAWYPGQRGGEAVADVLFGDYNPSGRLPLTFYASTEDLPDFEDYNMTNRTYRYYTGKPIYPFGYGLSYTSFKYGACRISGHGDGRVARVEVTNIGNRSGEEVVQVYIRDRGDVGGAHKTLRGFGRVYLKSGERKVVEIALPDTAFEFFDEESKRLKVRGGTYDVMYGSSSADSDLRSIEYSF